MRASAFPTSKSVVQLDGIWVTIQSQEEKIKPDKRKRRRKQRTGKKIVILVAPSASGKMAGVKSSIGRWLEAESIPIGKSC